MQQGVTLWFTGLSGAGKTTVARAVEEELKRRGCRVEVLDGDVIRTNLSQGLSFSREDRDINVRRIGFVASLLSRHGVIAIVAAISPYRSTREEVRAMTENFLEVYVCTPLEVCESRDVKGLYARARSGQILGFTGIDDPYEAPLDPEIVCPTVGRSIEESSAEILSKLEMFGYIEPLPALVPTGGHGLNGNDG